MYKVAVPGAAGTPPFLTFSVEMCYSTLFSKWNKLGYYIALAVSSNNTISKTGYDWTLLILY
jgi:hypothetical protein